MTRRILVRFDLYGVMGWQPSFLSVAVRWVH